MGHCIYLLIITDYENENVLCIIQADLVNEIIEI